MQNANGFSRGYVEFSIGGDVDPRGQPCEQSRGPHSLSQAATH